MDRRGIKEISLVLPDNWAQTNSDVVSFRYEHKDKPEYEFFFKMFETDANKMEINAFKAKKA